jgi:membrane protease YdiL (CAAX protease family)
MKRRAMSMSQESPSAEADQVVVAEELDTADAEDVVIEDNKWYGVPPKGKQPLPEKYKYVLLLFLVIGIQICIWAVYRKLSADLISPFGSYKFYFAHIIAAPTIHLIPILLFWRYMRKEKGLPFVFTKKLIMSGIIVGFIAAIIWRLLEEFVYDAAAGAAGGTAPGTLTFFNLLDPPLLFTLMTFVQFFIVGPVEELEFRGFAQDQGARVLPNWQALVFSSVLFGCSHIPIALFVYQFPPHVFVAALWGWISAGFVFGILYLYSRNIFACIVMHGMGNWLLSVFYFQSAETSMAPAAYTMASITTNIIVDGLMIFLFFIIHKYYWQPHRRGEPAFGGIFLKLQDFVHEHDFEQKPLQTTMTILVVFCVVIGSIIAGVSYAFGETDLSKMVAGSQDSGEGDISYLESLIQENETLGSSSTLSEGNSESFTFSSEADKYIKSVKVTVTWIDENDWPNTHEDQPDTFSVRIISPNNETIEDTGSNTVNGPGMITATLNFTYEELSNIISTYKEKYEILIEVTLEEAGDYDPIVGPGIVFSQPDTQNDYDYEIVIIWLKTEE